MTFEHDFPDALTHYYRPGGVDEDLLLYSGTFCLPDDDEPYEGDVRWRWGTSPRIDVRGSREPRTADLMKFLNGMNDPGLWVNTNEIGIELPSGHLPPQPIELAGQSADDLSSIGLTVEQQLGDASNLERVTFLLPNGWQGEGWGICEPGEPTTTWQGRTVAEGGGWTVTLDRRREMTGREAWKDLKNRRGQQFTHVGELRRTDGSVFTGEDAFDALDRVRLGLNLALGRRTTCALPVGYWQGDPTWCRWRSAPVDSYQNSTQWLDETVADQQVVELLGLVLNLTVDDADLTALRYALGYYIAGNVDVNVDLTVSIPVSGLQLLAYYRFMTQRQDYSHTAWKKLDTEVQVRLLLDDIGVDTDVKPHFAHLEAARARISTPQKNRDALGAVMKMRNVVTHPTRESPTMFSIYELAEAGMHARYWLCLALLNTIGYVGPIAMVHQEKTRWVGQVHNPPWVARITVA
ncbi:hypothetical protein [Cellulomonas sp. Root137]|uniref:hypothetical protein n=1 Tax=Cellulomonas sp. Root137 TaxID=1736459 RepID=UPI0012E3B348|nr:hypothetical protein [Cellulomonas sp. Root137]